MLQRALDASPRVVAQARRAQALSARASGAAASRPAAVQRMVLNMQPGDESITKDADNIAKTTGGAAQTDVSALSGMEAGETLHVVAHLEEATIAGHAPEELAALFAPQLEGKSDISIDLHGCFAANPRAMNKEQVGGLDELWDSYAGRFQKALSALGVKLPVSASLGAEYTSDSGITRVRGPQESKGTLDDAVNARAQHLGGLHPSLGHYRQATNEIIEDPMRGIFLGENEGRLIFKDAETDAIDLATGQDFSDVEQDGPFDPEAYAIVE